MENQPPNESPEPRRRVRVSRVVKLDPLAPDNVGIAVAAVKLPKASKRKGGRIKTAGPDASPDIFTPPVPQMNTPNVVSLDAPLEWVDYPTVKDQIRDKNAVKLDKTEAKIFNLGVEADLSKYNALLAETSKESTNVFVVQEDRQFAPALGTFQVFLKLQYVKYRKLLTTKKES